MVKRYLQHNSHTIIYGVALFYKPMIYKYLSVVFAASIKFFGGPLAGLALGLPWYVTALCTLVGMMFSVTITSFLGQALQNMFLKNRKMKRFSRRTRWAVKLWQKAGLWGIALFTPIFLTPIGGAALAVSFKAPVAKILAYMLASGILWAIVVTGAFYGLMDMLR